MQLGLVYNAFPAWQALSAMKMQPSVAYKILKYVKLVSAEWDVAEKQRITLIHELTKTQPGENARIEPETREFMDYVSRFGAILETECDLQPFGMDLGEVMASMEPNQSNSLSVQELGLLEPFFTEETSAPEEAPAVAGKIG